jgi:type II secretory pathway pseudopilin PulG
MKRTTSPQESGYALLSLLVAMTIGLALLASSMSKPSAQFVGQREMEEEAFFRAHQVSYAIQRYAELKGGLSPQNLPTKLEDLLKSVVVTTNASVQEQHILRPSALIDPLTGTEWKPVRLGDPKIREFARTYQQFLLEQQAQLMAAGAGGQAVGAQQSTQFPPLLMFAAQAAGVNLANPSDSKEEEENKPTTASGFSLDLDSDNRPIVGVISSLKKTMIRNYYGIASYDKAIFIAGVPVPGNYPVPSGGGVGVQGGVPALGTGGQQNEPDGRPRLVPGQFRRNNQ